MAGHSPPIPAPTLDFILTAQFVVAWAGETGEEPRLGWWRSDLVSEYGGVDLFRRLLPDTWQWAILQAVREAARRHDAKLRRREHDPDRIYSLYNLGFELDELLDERLADLKREANPPQEALPGLREVMLEHWQPGAFTDWVAGHGDADHAASPVGRRLKGEPPSSPERAVRALVAALRPLGDDYPLPHFRRPG